MLAVQERMQGWSWGPMGAKFLHSCRSRKKDAGKPKSLLKLEKKLENWLAQRSLAQILDWFDCIETTRVQTAMANYRWSTESVARDKLFLEYLRVGTK